MKKIGIITSGGDCGGLNAVIHGAATMAWNQGMEVAIIPNGYAGLYNLNEIQPRTIDKRKVFQIDSHAAGSEAGHSRVKISKIQDSEKYEKIKSGLKKHQIDALIIAGGDDTGSVVVDLGEQGIPCVHVPKTMDLDLQPYSVGGDSTINRISIFTRDLRTTGVTHNRALVIEVFGRYAGHTAFRGGVGADADCILIPEIPVDYGIVYDHFKRTYMQRLSESDVKESTYILVVAEGIKDSRGELIINNEEKDAFGHVKLSGAGKYVRKQLETFAKKDPDWTPFLKKHGIFVKGIYEVPEIREILLGHLVRAGRTSSYDVSFGKQAGAAAVLLVKNNMTNVTVTGVHGNKISYISTPDAIQQRYVDLHEIALYEAMGVCFGRNPEKFSPEFLSHQGPIQRFL